MSSTNRQTQRTGELPAVSFLNLRFLAVFVLFSAYCQLSNWTRSSSSRRLMSLRGASVSSIHACAAIPRRQTEGTYSFTK